MEAGPCKTTMSPLTTTESPTMEPTMDTDDKRTTDNTIVDETGTTTVPIPVPTPAPTNVDVNTGSVMRMSVGLPAIVGAFGYIFFSGDVRFLYLQFFFFCSFVFLF